MTHTLNSVGELCPTCAIPLVTEGSALPWCGRCEWRLGVPAGLSGIYRWTYRASYRLNAAQFAALAGRPVGRPGFGWAGAVLVAVSVLLYAAMAALVAAGVYLEIDLLGNPIMMVLALVPIGVAFVLVPRFGRIPSDLVELTADRAPALFALVGRVAAATGAPMPTILGVDSDFNAYATTFGLRRRRVLCVGLPLWAALPPAQRVALLGHELGHFVNGDLRRSTVTIPALTAFERLADLLDPGHRSAGGGGSAAGFIAVIAEGLARVLMWPVRQVLLLVHVGLLWIASRSSQRAEYHADELGAHVGGSEGARGLEDSLVGARALSMLMSREARNGTPPREWIRAADEARASMAGRLPALRQLSLREDASLFSSHPPSGLRARMIESRPWRDAAVVLTEGESALVDAELAPLFERRRRDIGQAGA